MVSIGIDIGGSHITCCMYEHSDKELIKNTWVSVKLDNKAPMDQILSVWTSAILKSIELCKEKVKGLGLAMPGPFDYYNGISLIKGVNKYEALYNVNIRKELSERLGMDGQNIRFINDATAFSIAEASLGQAAFYSRCVAITLGTGLGSSFLVDRQPLLNGPGVPSGGFLYDKKYRDQIADNVFSSRGILSRYKILSGKEASSVLEISNGLPVDQNAKEVFKTFGKELGEFLQPYLDAFGAEVLVLGGNIAKAFPHFVDDLSRELPGTEIYLSRYGEEAAIIGGALLLDDVYYAKLEDSLKIM